MSAPELISTVVDGQLEIDHARGVIYFHSSEGRTLLRICSLPRPIPRPTDLLDITHLYACSWSGADVERQAASLRPLSQPNTGLRLRKPHNPTTDTTPTT